LGLMQSPFRFHLVLAPAVVVNANPCIVPTPHAKVTAYIRPPTAPSPAETARPTASIYLPSHGDCTLAAAWTRCARAFKCILLEPAFAPTSRASSADAPGLPSRTYRRMYLVRPRPPSCLRGRRSRGVAGAFLRPLEGVASSGSRPTAVAFPLPVGGGGTARVFG